MRKETTIGGKQCYLYGFDEGGSGCPVAALPLLVQPADDHDLSVLDSEVVEIQRLYGAGFRLAAFKVDDWNADLSPWEAPPAFGNEPFGGKAEQTLDYIENELLPALLGESGASASDAPVILGGYSLAGLFALWAGTRGERFHGIAAASPSVWFPGWIEYAEKHWQSAPEGTGQGVGGRRPGGSGFAARLHLWGENMTIKDMGIRETAVVSRVGGEGALRQHFLDMGVIPGAEVTVVKFAPMGDPVELKIHGYELTLRLEDAAKIVCDAALKSSNGPPKRIVKLSPLRKQARDSGLHISS